MRANAKPVDTAVMASSHLAIQIKPPQIIGPSSSRNHVHGLGIVGHVVATSTSTSSSALGSGIFPGAFLAFFGVLGAVVRGLRGVRRQGVPLVPVDLFPSLPPEVPAAARGRSVRIDGLRSGPADGAKFRRLEREGYVAP
eukprot:CAMPEP_0167804104 /NCGR_PEP_ID=MMETSP0111_2-20121227/20268_1 /TAXON_ID=91324 /ORGANISM="Lotharella globosa, Strain CCCM811" /LENGTH=139 /DNA_ID=CAMNT_0007700771 /DNA_START=481 /DNA_END=899 /DNA_ORIENTATION=-